MKGGGEREGRGKAQREEGWTRKETKKRDGTRTRQKRSEVYVSWPHHVPSSETPGARDAGALVLTKSGVGSRGGDER